MEYQYYKCAFVVTFSLLVRLLVRLMAFTVHSIIFVSLKGIKKDYFLVYQSEIKEELIDADTKNFTC